MKTSFFTQLCHIHARCKCSRRGDEWHAEDALQWLTMKPSPPCRVSLFSLNRVENWRRMVPVVGNFMLMYGCYSCLSLMEEILSAAASSLLHMDLIDLSFLSRRLKTHHRWVFEKTNIIFDVFLMMHYITRSIWTSVSWAIFFLLFRSPQSDLVVLLDKNVLPTQLVFFLICFITERDVKTLYFTLKPTEVSRSVSVS